MPGKRIGKVIIPAVILLWLITLSIRSGVLVDTTFQPRFILVSLVLFLFSIYLLFRMKELKLSTFDLIFLFFLGWNFFSAAWAIVPSEAIQQSLLVLLSFSIYLFIRLALERGVDPAVLIVRPVLALMLFSIILAFIRMATIEYYDPYRIFGIAANNNLHAGFLLLTLAVALAGYSIFRGWMKYMSLTLAIAALFWIIILQSRAVYLALFTAFIIFLIGILWKFSALLTRKNLLTGLVSLSILIFSVTLFYNSLDPTRQSYFLSKVPVWQYFRSYDNTLKKERELQMKTKAALTGIPSFDFAGSYYENANLRLIFWQKSACLAARHPLTGVGAGNWRIAVPSCPKPENPDHTWKNYTYSQPHNEYIALFTELGMVGFLTGMFIFFIPAFLILVKILKNGNSLPFRSFLMASFMAGFLVYAFFDFPFRRIEHNVLFFALSAWLLVDQHYFWKEKSLKFNQLKLFLSVLVLSLVFAVMVSALRIKGEYYTLKMFRQEGKDNNLVIRYSDQASGIFYRITPNTLPLDWFSGVSLYRTGRITEALESFEQAAKVTPYEVRVLNDRAAALNSLGRESEALAHLLNILALDPWFDDVRFNLAAIYYRRGEKSKAMMIIRPCRESKRKSNFVRELN